MRNRNHSAVENTKPNAYVTRAGEKAASSVYTYLSIAFLGSSGIESSHPLYDIVKQKHESVFDFHGATHIHSTA